MQVLYQLSADTELAGALEKARATLNATMPLLKVFQEEQVTQDSIRRLATLAIENVEVWRQHDPDRADNKKVHSSCHCVDSVTSAGAALHYCTAQFERRHKRIRSYVGDLIITLYRALILASNHRSVGQTILLHFMATEQFQIFSAAELFTKAEADLFSLLPKFQRRAKIEPSTRVPAAITFGLEERLGKFEYFTKRGPSGMRSSHFNSQLQNIRALTDLDEEAADFVFSALQIAVLKQHTRRRGDVVIYNRFNTAVRFLLNRGRLRLNETKYHQSIDLVENQWFSCRGVDGTTFIARLFLIVRIDAVAAPLLFCQRGIADAAPTIAHGLEARRIQLDPSPMLLPVDMHSSVRVASIIHDCCQAKFEGKPCEFVNDYPKTSFSSGKKVYVPLRCLVFF
jgi:hypothetical protein